MPSQSTLDNHKLSELQSLLESRLAGEVRFDPYTRVLYSTDASNYQVQPLGVVFPRHADELSAVVETAASLGVPMLPRGGGTSLGGQSIGPALIIDCARHLHRIRHINPEQRLAVVEPGVTCSALDNAGKPHALHFGAAPSSANRATVGGMIGNNASGAHSIRYGMTADQIVEADVVLADGSLANLAPLSLATARSRAQHGDLEGGIYRSLLSLRETAADAVRSDWPKTWRRASGYNLDYLVGYSPGQPSNWYAAPDPYPMLSPGKLNLAPLLAGSEGTLAVIREATVRLVPRPAYTVLLVLPFDSVAEAGDATPGILVTAPEAVELIPRMLITQARRVQDYARRLTFVDGDPAALLVLEYGGDTPEAALAAAGRLGLPGRLLVTPEAQADLWAVRKAGLGLLMLAPGAAKPIPFVEDVVVPVNCLGDYIRCADRILAEHGTHGEWYGHISAGCLHLRPLIDLKTPDGVVRMRAIAEAMVELVAGLRGALSGEHGDGLSRSEFSARLFGPDIMAAFEQIKRTFDPAGLLNPGKVIPLAGEAGRTLDRNLRYGEAYRPIAPPTTFSFAAEGGLLGAVEACNGVGVCRKEGGLMCPSYHVTRQEMHTTRGRANALRAALSGHLPATALNDQQMYDVLDLCLECKGCKAECPTSVDMARVKSEFLAQYQREHGVPLRSRLFGEYAVMARLAHFVARPLNWLSGSGVVRSVMEAVLGISRRRRLPAFATQTFRQWFHRQPKLPAGGNSRVVLFVDTYTEYNTPAIGQAAVRVLARAGCQVELVRGQVCCGRTLISKGLLERARELAARNLDVLAPYAAQGVPIVGLEPSCLLAMRDEYRDLFPGDARAEALGRRALLIEEFLTQRADDGLRPVDRLSLKPRRVSVLLHGHCHTKALVGDRPMLDMLGAAGATVIDSKAGCCGMAGSFGYEREHFGLSQSVGELQLFPAVRALPDAPVLAAGMSCRTQILDGTGVVARHPIQLLDEWLPA
jgi:FAD/FMN-containing dehydrogenase/Fe-S oxidoreductase